MRVVVVACDERRQRRPRRPAREDRRSTRDALAALMVTYPSTHGVFEETITELCALVHDAGGQVYVDGANLNALVGLAKPGQFGADVSHLNLHKTFCIPHGGGGPGVGPVGGARAPGAVPARTTRCVPEAGPSTRRRRPGPAAPWGSAGILPISWAYIRLMGADGLTARHPGRDPDGQLRRRAGCATHYPVLYTGHDGLVAHECILDLRQLTKATGVTRRRRRQAADRLRLPRADDVVPGRRHADGRADRERGPRRARPVLRRDDRDPRRDRPGRGGGVAGRRQPAAQRAAHGASRSSASGRTRTPREEAAFPLASLRRDKYWPPVRRIDGAYGDRNLVCVCGSPEDYES